tara:strand:+ start:625 stop:1233 length:609 start_codon:yes stop_codon:yes gene_type:complete
MSIFVLDDVVPKALQKTIAGTLLSPNFPLYWNAKTVEFTEGGDSPGLFWDNNTKDSPQLTHSVIVDGNQTSEHWGLLRTILYQVIAKTDMELEVVRCKINVTFPQCNFSFGEYYPPHIDTVHQAEFTAIYYVNDADGDTLFFKTPAQNRLDGAFVVQQAVTPKQGRLVFFDNKTVHCGAPPKNSNTRCVINFNFAQIGDLEC